MKILLRVISIVALIFSWSSYSDISSTSEVITTDERILAIEIEKHEKLVKEKDRIWSIIGADVEELQGIIEQAEKVKTELPWGIWAKGFVKGFIGGHFENPDIIVGAMDEESEEIKAWNASHNEQLAPLMNRGRELEAKLRPYLKTFEPLSKSVEESEKTIEEGHNIITTLNQSLASAKDSLKFWLFVMVITALFSIEGFMKMVRTIFTK